MQHHAAGDRDEVVERTAADIAHIVDRQQLGTLNLLDTAGNLDDGPHT